MKTRWGSCSSKNNISLNSSLVFLPEALIRYVCLHELVHTIHKNHGRVFWEALTGILPEALMLRKGVKKTVHYCLIKQNTIVLLSFVASITIQLFFFDDQL
jgi:predicted metal-dependent hydrolase